MFQFWKKKEPDFIPESATPWPTTSGALQLTDYCKNLLQQCQNIRKPDTSKVHIEEFMEKSNNFPMKFGTNTCRVMSQPKERYPIIEQQIASAYPVIHERVLGLYLAYLEHMSRYANDIERPIYHELSLTDFVQRLLKQRCASFCGPKDAYILINNEDGLGGFRKVGTVDEEPPLVLSNVLNYNEIKLSAFLSVSSHTEFLNDGNRHNAGRIEEDKSRIETEGVVVGLIGGRFQRSNVMEWQDILISSEQNIKENGYGLGLEEEPKNRAEAYRRLWNQFYEETDTLYVNACKTKAARFYKNPHWKIIFDNLMMKKRYAISFETLLLETEARAAAADKNAFIHVVGIGLGVWKVVQHQVNIFLETFEERLRELIPKLSHVSAAHFSWFGLKELGELKDGGIIECETHPQGGIKTFLSNRNPASKMSPEFEDCLVVVSYAWDANALPGNEFWGGSLTSSCDPSTACSTLISELHNPHINEDMVNGNNLHIASPGHGIEHISDYSTRVLN